MNSIQALKNPFQQTIGGKAKNLLQLKRNGIKVPKWYILPAEVLLDQLPINPKKEELSTLFQSLLVSPDLLKQIAKFFGADHATKSYAVRSSAIDEDGQAFSFAGQFDTFLHVSFSSLVDNIKRVWQSAISERVLHYRSENNLPIQPGIAVIIQEMIEPEVAGVAFGMNPVSGDTDSKIISAVYGLGEGLVSGALDADVFTLNATKITQTLAHKAHAFVPNHNGSGIKKIAVPKHRQKKASLTNPQLLAIAKILDQLAKELGGPQDIEFAFSKGQLYLLQTRPITAHGTQAQGEYILWDNSNIIESYPGITTPLTFSFIKKMYAVVYAQFSELMGVTQKEIAKHADVFDNTLGLVRGRVYYNLLSWYKMLAMLPGYSINAEYMENMMGVKERFELSDEFKMSKQFAWWRIFRMGFKMIGLQAKLPRQRKNFFAHLHQTMNHYQSIDFLALTPAEIIGHYKNFEQNLLLEWKAPLVNDFFAMIWFGMLKKLTAQYCPEEPNLHNDLLCGNQDIISVEPIRQIMNLAKMVQKRKATHHLFKEHHPEEIWASLESGNFPPLKKAIDHYLLAFGDRCVGELKLESISYTQKPSLFIKIVQSYVRQGISPQQATKTIEEEIRTTAEQKINLALKNNPIKRRWFQFVLQKARDLVSNRENLRYERTRGFGMVRNMFSALGEQWYRVGKLENPRDIFYLELPEIMALEQAPFTEALKHKITERQKEFTQYHQQVPPQERFSTYGHHFTDESIYSSEKLDLTAQDLQGIGCCPGRVKAKVRVVKDPNEIDSLDGDILVTSSTDPGWVVLFPTASAIIVERGSLLSHSAIVAREMGIPCIVSVTGLLRRLKTGDEVLMDGRTGQIKILS